MSYARRYGMNFVRYGHSDFGPGYEPFFRRMLVHRYGVPEEQAQRCGLAVANLWAPLDHPAYRDPLCLLDVSSLRDPEKETVLITGAAAARRRESPTTAKPRPPDQLPSGGDAPSLAPVYAPHHRWVYCSDMRPDEAMVFKQYDFRKKTKASARATFHHSFPDRFYNDWKECPPRHSIECRVCLMFDEEDASVSASKL